MCLHLIYINVKRRLMLRSNFPLREWQMECWKIELNFPKLFFWGFFWSFWLTRTYNWHFGVISPFSWLPNEMYNWETENLQVSMRFYVRLGLSRLCLHLIGRWQQLVPPPTVTPLGCHGCVCVIDNHSLYALWPEVSSQRECCVFTHEEARS